MNRRERVPYEELPDLGEKNEADLELAQGPHLWILYQERGLFVLEVGRLSGRGLDKFAAKMDWYAKWLAKQGRHCPLASLEQIEMEL